VTGDTVAIILAAGAGERMGRGEPKAFISISGTSMLGLAAGATARCPRVDSIVVAAPAGMEDRAQQAVGVKVTAVAGGRSRQESVALALEVVPWDAKRVVCHDAARPFATPDLFTRVLGALSESEGAVPIVPVTDTVKRVGDDMVVATEPRERLGLAQTPQAFRADALRDAHERAEKEGVEFTDDAALVEWAGYTVRAVPGEVENIKITNPMDLARAELLYGAFHLESSG
jgi:2-C-methyl-D-erythritol 4-phosphate cytidylyltransferase/2-C-methyl-D-erythritol 2,4-cyclodiphosphate synthase